MFLFFKAGKSISANDLKDKLGKVTLLDVRELREYKAGHIPQAKNKPLGRIQDYNGKEETVYVVCQSGARSSRAAKILRKKGYDAINVKGGMNAWRGSVIS